MHITGPRGPQGCETSGLPYFLDSRLTEGGEVIPPIPSLQVKQNNQKENWKVTRRPPFTPRKIPGTHFC
jgi:hypothetical protein